MAIRPELPKVGAEPLWEEWCSWLLTRYPRGDVPLMVIEWSPIHCQAILAHDAGARELAAIGCRSAVESVGYVFRYWRPDGKGGWSRQERMTRAGKPERWEYSLVKESLREAGELSPAVELALDHIKFDGDAAAHISKRAYEEFDRLRSGKSPRPGAPSDPDQVWMTREDVLRDLRETIEVFKAVVLAADRERERARAAAEAAG